MSFSNSKHIPESPASETSSRATIDGLLDILLAIMTTGETWDWLHQPIANLGIYVKYEDNITVIEVWDMYPNSRSHILESARLIHKDSKDQS